MAKSENNLKAVLKDTADAIRAKKDSEDLIEPRDFADEITSIPTGPELENGNLYFYNDDEAQEVNGGWLYFWDDVGSFVAPLDDQYNNTWGYLSGGSTGAEFTPLSNGLLYHSDDQVDEVNISAGSKYTYTGDGDFESYEPSLDDFDSEELQTALGMNAGSVYYANGGSGIELLDMSDYGIYSYNPNYHEVAQAELPESGAKTTIAVGDLGEYVIQEPVYYDIFNANEAVIPSGTLEITENGENINVSQYAAVTVSVSGGGGGTDALDELMQESF